MARSRAAAISAVYVAFQFVNQMYLVHPSQINQLLKYMYGKEKDNWLKIINP